jgi:hypothetical protein
MACLLIYLDFNGSYIAQIELDSSADRCFSAHLFSFPVSALNDKINVGQINLKTHPWSSLTSFTLSKPLSKTEKTLSINGGFVASLSHLCLLPLISFIFSIYSSQTRNHHHHYPSLTLLLQTPILRSDQDPQFPRLRFSNQSPPPQAPQTQLSLNQNPNLPSQLWRLLYLPQHRQTPANHIFPFGHWQ